jgi:hypothetical protein
MTTNRRVPQGYNGFAETTDTEVYAAPKDYTDPARTNPDLEATRDRYNTLYCNSVAPQPPSDTGTFNPMWPVSCIIVVVGLCFIASLG